MKSTDNSIILFDGVCNLCNGAINFVIDRDPNRHFRYGALQSEQGIQYMNQFNMPAEVLETIVLVESDTYYVKSTAALRIARRLSGIWPLMYGFIIIPAFMRDMVYDFIARNRYRWFGKMDACRVPTPELKSLFLD